MRTRRESRGERHPATAGSGIASRDLGLVTRSIRRPEDPMSGWDLEIIIEETQRLVAMSAGDAELRARLRAHAQEILAKTGDHVPVAVIRPGDDPFRRRR